MKVMLVYSNWGPPTIGSEHLQGSPQSFRPRWLIKKFKWYQS